MAERDSKGLDTSVLSSFSRAEMAYQALREAIHEGRLRPGDRVRETEVAAQLGVSRTPVRDALKRLESDGLLVFTAHRGLAVAQVDQHQLIELYTLREELEGLATRLASQHISEAEIRMMRQLVDRQREIPPGDAAGQVRLSHQFHQVIYDAARNRYVMATILSMRGSLALLGRSAYVAPGREALALEEHEQIVDAIERRDAVQAEDAARHHVRMALQVRLSLMMDEGSPPAQL